MDSAKKDDLRDSLDDWIVNGLRDAERRRESIGPIKASTGEDVAAGRVAAYQAGYQNGVKATLTDASAILARHPAPPARKDLREAVARIESLSADLVKFHDDSVDARTWGGPTILPRHPIDERRAATDAKALRLILAALPQGEAEPRFWLILREPRCVPERKGPWPSTKTVQVLREFMAARPTAHITVLSIIDGEPCVQDAPECLLGLDGRSRTTAAKHIASTRAAHPAQPAPDRVSVRFTGRKHDLKTWPEPFAAVRANLKPWELRHNDRDYQIGDLLWLQEWDPESGTYTGEATGRLITWMLHGPAFGLPDGYVIMSLDTFPSEPAPDRVSVPREPTEAMIRAWLAEQYRQSMLPPSQTPDPASCYRAMLDALLATGGE